jgi:hypothetical protein
MSVNCVYSCTRVHLFVLVWELVFVWELFLRSSFTCCTIFQNKKQFGNTNRVRPYPLLLNLVRDVTRPVSDGRSPTYLTSPHTLTNPHRSKLIHMMIHTQPKTSPASLTSMLTSRGKWNLEYLVETWNKQSRFEELVARITVTLSIFNFRTWFFTQIVENRETQLSSPFLGPGDNFSKKVMTKTRFRRGMFTWT